MTEIVDDLMACERRWMEAVRLKDMELLERLLAPDFTYTATGHGRRSRQEWLAMVPRYEIDRFTFEEPEIRVYGDLALVLVRYRQVALVDGVPRSGLFLLTDVWMRQPAGWQVVNRCSIHTPDIAA